MNDNVSGEVVVNLDDMDNNIWTTDNSMMHISWPQHEITWVGDPLPYYDPGKWTYPPIIPITTNCPAEKDSSAFRKIIEALNNEKEQRRSSNMMNVYEVIVIDKKSCEMIKEQKVIAKDTETAMLELDLSPDIRKKVKNGEVEFIFKKLGEFEKIEEDKK